MSDQKPVIDQSLVGYVRVSTEEQTYDLQVDALLNAGVDPDLIYSDVESGLKPIEKREGLRDALLACRPGGALLVWRLDRLGRNTIEIIKTVDSLRERGIDFQCITQSEINTQAMDTPSGQLIFTIFAALAQFESDQISFRTKAGQKAAQKRGVRIGRKTYHELYEETGIADEMRRLLKNGVGPRQACEQAGMKYTTFCKHKEKLLPAPNVDEIND